MEQTTFNYNKSISYMIFMASSGGQLPPLAPPPLALPLNPGSFRILDSFPGSPNIFLIAPREATDDWNVPVGIDSIANLLGNGLHGLEIIVGGGGEAGLDDVDAELGELDAYDEVFYFIFYLVFKTHVIRLFFFWFSEIIFKSE